jgi:hypothetical protein
MWGKKARVYYHGIPGFCVACHETGHVKNDCDSDSISWRDYIKKLVADGVPKPLFGSWLATNITFSRSSQSDIARPIFRKRKSSSSDSDSDNDQDLSSIPPHMQKLFKKFLASTPNHSNTSSKNSTRSNSGSNKKSDSKKEEKRSPSRNRNRGRGRGRGVNRDQSANRGKGRGRGKQ